jgi:DNA-binding response OmpR family regulator
VKKFAELHGGFVSLASSPGEGSTFSVMLPVQFPWAARRPEGAAFLNAEGRPKVLVVEDDEQAYETLALHLAKAGFGPVRARTGEEALRMVHALRPAAVTLDIVLPDMDGWEVLKKLKEEPGGARFPVVIVSRLGNRELGLALGADDYFLKPIEGEAFTRRLKALIPQAPPSECKLLVVDDDPKVHDLLEAILGDAGYRVEHALSGHAALELVGRCAPDLIVLDLLMEGMSGFEVAGRLSARPETASIPVVVLTAKELTGEERRALSGKISAMLQKTGTSPEVLVNMVRSLLQRRSRPAS